MKISSIPENLIAYKNLIIILLKYSNKDVFKSLDEKDLLLDEKSKDAKNETSHELADDLSKMGPSFVKFGQFLSTRSDIISTEYLEPLTRLQNNVEPVAIDDIHKIILEELGTRISKAFLDFETTPFASASIAQVYKAKLKNGNSVVVKIQRPGIREKMFKDIEVLESIVNFVETFSDMPERINLSNTLEEFTKVTIRELDFNNEVQNLKIISKNLKEFKNIVVPKPYEDFSSSKIVTMDFITGKSVTSVSPLTLMEIDGINLADELFRAYLQQVLIDGFYHCDPHPGNILLTDDKKIALLDLGMVAYLSEDVQIKLSKMLIALGNKNASDVADYTLQMGEPKKNYDEVLFKKKITELVSQQGALPLEKIQTGKLVMEVSRISAECGVRLPNDMIMLGKTLMNLDKIGKTLNPKFNPNQSIYDNSDALFQKRLSKTTSSKKPYELLIESKEFFEKLPQRLNKIFDTITENKLKVKVNAFDEKYLMSGLQKIANRITLGIITAALIIGAALIMKIDTGEFKIIGYPPLSFILFLAAVITGIGIIISIFVQDEKVKKKDEIDKKNSF